MNKSLISNLIALAILLFSFLETSMAGISFSVGMFALSGGITNWLAIHMLFDKIPFVFGSGVVEIRFEEFKRGIRKLILEEFFNKKNIEVIHNDLRNEAISKLNDNFNDDEIFNSFIQVVENSSFNKTLEMFGGTQILNPLKEPLIHKFQQILSKLTEPDNQTEGISIEKLEIEIIEVIDTKLEELTPKKVKKIVQTMIRQHLGWLVVWGTVIGGAIGLVFGITTN